MSHRVVKQLRATLRRIKYTERYSGVRKCIISAAIGDMAMTDIKRLLQVGGEWER